MLTEVDICKLSSSVQVFETIIAHYFPSAIPYWRYIISRTERYYRIVFDQPQFLGAFPKNVTQLIAKEKAGRGDATLPTAHIDSRGPNLLCHIFLRPEALFALGLQQQIRNGFILHGSSS